MIRTACILTWVSALLSFFFLTSSSTTHQPKSSSDSTWKVKALVKFGDPAPGTGGTFTEFGRSYFLKSGVLVFWGKYGDDKKDWALYSYKEGKTQLVFRGYTDFTEPDGVKKKYTEAITPFRFWESKNMLCFSYHKGLNSYYTYGWDGDKLFRLLGEGDKLPLPQYKDYTIADCIMSEVKNDDRMIVSFTTREPEKMEGWLLYDGITYSKLFMKGEELPGSAGIKIKHILSDPIIFGDTVLIKIQAESAPFKEAILKITKTTTEKIIAVGDTHPAFSDKKVVDIRTFYASAPDHLIIDASSTNRIPQTASSSLMLYNKGSWKTIISSSDDLQIPKGFGGYKVESPVFIETDKNNVLLPVSIGKTDYFTTTSGTTVQSYFVPYAIYLYNGNNLITIDKDELKIVSSASAPARVRPMPVMNGAITTLSLFGDAKFFRYNLANPKVEPLPELRTEGTEKFLLSSIIATYDENRVIATTTRTVESKRNKEILTAGFFELTRAIQ